MAKRPAANTRKMTVADAVSEAFCEITSLGEELREAFDNTPESLQQSSVGEAREQAADALEEIQEVDVPEVLQQIELSISLPGRTPKQQMKLSRAARRDDATSILQQVIDDLNDWAEEDGRSLDDKSAVEEFTNELEEAKENAECVDFPGRHG